MRSLCLRAFVVNVRHLEQDGVSAFFGDQGVEVLDDQFPADEHRLDLTRAQVFADRGAHGGLVERADTFQSQSIMSALRTK